MGLQYSSGNETVDRVGQIDFSFGDSGNWIMSTWYDVLRYDSGKVNLNACVVLSEIVYWYRPTVVRDEVSGGIKEVRTKFKADKLQKNYQDLGNRFGLTKRQTTDAVIFLEHKGIVKREFRDITTETGLILTNVLFLDLNVERLLEISFPKETRDKMDVPRSEGGVTFKRDTSHVQTGYPPRPSVAPATFECETYTTNTTTTTTSNTPSSSHPAGHMPEARAAEMEETESEARTYEEMIADNIGLDSLMQSAEKEGEKERVQMLYKIICKVVTSKKKTEKINSEEIPREVAKSVFLKIGYGEIVYVCDKLDEPKDKPIYNLESYIKTLLYNAKTVSKEHWTQKVNFDLYGGGAEDMRRKRTSKKKSGFLNIEENNYDYGELEDLLANGGKAKGAHL